MLLTKASRVGLPIMRVKYNFTYWDWELLPKPWRLPLTKKEKRMLYPKKDCILPSYTANLNDTLHVPGTDDTKLKILYREFMQYPETPVSSQNIAMLIYNFAKQDMITPQIWPYLENWVTRNRGQYSNRSIFGCLYGIIKMGKIQYIDFFVDQMKGMTLSFTDMEALEIMEAFNSSKHTYTAQFKHYFWDTYFKQHFLKTMEGFRVKKYQTAIRIFDAFDKFEYYHDEQIWNLILGWLQKRKGWKRTEIIQRLYPLTGTFQKAKEVFDTYYAELSTNPEVAWRYNLEQMRLYTSEEMIAKSQINIKMFPTDRTLVARKDQKKMIEEHLQWLKDGARQKEAELVKDKAQSLAYAIKNRYERMKKQNVDFSKLSVQQFEDLFGTYDKTLMYKNQEGIEQQISEQQAVKILLERNKGAKSSVQDQDE